MMTDPVVPVGRRRCWFCLAAVMMMWHQGQNRTYCPVCQHTQPPRGNPNTARERIVWALMRSKYHELEGVTIEQQRGIQTHDPG